MTGADAHTTAIVVPDDAHAAAAAMREVRYWRARRASAEVVRPPTEVDMASFGATVTLRRDDGREQTFRIVGPPGAGKTFTGARMICELVRRGKKVGITANSHKVIRNLIDATIKAADELGISLQCCQKADKQTPPDIGSSLPRRMKTCSGP
jgi:reverse gyrase